MLRFEDMTVDRLLQLPLEEVKEILLDIRYGTDEQLAAIALVMANVQRAVYVNTGLGDKDQMHMMLGFAIPAEPYYQPLAAMSINSGMWRRDYRQIATGKGVVSARTHKSTREVHRSHRSLLLPTDVEFWGSAVEEITYHGLNLEPVTRLMVAPNSGNSSRVDERVGQDSINNYSLLTYRRDEVRGFNR